MKNIFTFLGFTTLVWGTISCTEVQDQAELANNTLASTGEAWLTETPEYVQGERSIEVPGVLQFSESNTRAISFPISVQVQSIQVQPGSWVTPGQILATVRHPDLISLQQRYLDDLSEKAKQDRSFEKWKQLQDKGQASAMEWQEAQRAWTAAKTAVEADEASLRVFGIDPTSFTSVRVDIPVRAPFAGQVQSFFVEQGQFLTAEKPLTTLIRSSKPRVEASLSPDNLIGLSPGIQGVVVFQGETYAVKVTAVGQTTSTGSLVPVWCEFDRAPKLWQAGSAVTLSLRIPGVQGWAVPKSAVLYEGHQAIVIEWEDGALVKKPIELLYTNSTTSYYRGDANDAPRPVVIGDTQRAAAQVEEG